MFENELKTVFDNPAEAIAAIKATAEKLLPRLIEIRRHIHAHPELSGHEYQTAAYVAGVLSSCGLHVQESVGRTGVMAELPGSGQDSRRLAVRTDMDALPIEERSGVAFASRQQGLMHACGHDVHTTIGLGTVMVLAQLGLQLPGAVRFLFQPAEEITQGARWMVADGAIEAVDAIFGVHVFPTIPGGKIGIRYGALTAAADDIDVTIRGESGHGARPHEATDAIWIAAQVITTLQQAISRTQNPLHPVVLTFGQIKGGRASNVIADQVTLSGTVRCLHPETYDRMPTWIEDMVRNVCQTHGATYHFNYQRRVPSVQNDEVLTQIIQASVEASLGKDAIEHLREPSLGSEDFAVYLDHVPGTMFRLGVGFEDQPNYPLHHPKFVVNERSLLTGVVAMASAVYSYWQQPGSPAASTPSEAQSNKPSPLNRVQ